MAGAFADGVIQDGNDRPSLGLTGAYPQAVLMAGATGNPNHGSTLMLGSYDSGTSGAHKHWSIGTAGQNSTFLDIGYSGTDINPHAGIRNYNGATILTLLNTGNVGIGTTNPTHKLAVNGTIKAKEVIVETTGWSDYVFAEDYALAPLAEVEAHIKEHKHLPGIPSATQVAEQGISVGDMQARLLAKVEELTLYMIELKKENAELRGEVDALKRAAR